MYYSKTRTVRLYIILFFQFFIQAEKLDELLARYKRPMTVLEITSSAVEYVPHITKTYNAVGVAICDNWPALEPLYKKSEKYESLVLLNPTEFSLIDLRTLTECEHFDVVLIHDSALLKKFNSETMLGIARRLGNFVIIQAPKSWWNTVAESDRNCALFVETSGDDQAYCFYQEKSSLYKARWDMSPKAMAQQPRYEIMSTFDQKNLIKGDKKKVSPWIPGINLVTGIMLNIIFPDNHLLRENIKGFREVIHNDPVLGNMIVQGKKVTLIDFADERRNAHQEKCIKAALKIFTNHRRPSDPYDLMRKYIAYLRR